MYVRVCVRVYICACAFCLCKTLRPLERSSGFDKVFAVRSPVSLGLQNNTMRIVRSQEEALDKARSILSNELYELEKEIQSTLADIDGYSQDQVPEYLTNSLTRSKAKVADLTVARMSLYNISWHGTKEAPKA